MTASQLGQELGCGLVSFGWGGGEAPPSDCGSWDNGNGEGAMLRAGIKVVALRPAWETVISETLQS